MKFDWYQATVPGVEPDVMATALCGTYGGEWAALRPCRPRNSYTCADEVVLGDLVQATMLYGGPTGAHGVHVVATGSRAPALASLLRSRHPVHRVSRLDVAEDYRGDGAFPRLTRVVEDVAGALNVKTRWVRNSDPMDGDTLYVGSASSAVRLRVYEKGKELRGQGDESADLSMARVELMVRPQKDAKSLAAEWSLSQVWGVARFSHAVAQALGNVDLERVEFREWRQSDRERAISWMLRQYGLALRAEAAALGSFAALWSKLEAMLCATKEDGESLH